MNRSVSRTRLVLVVGLMCLVVLAVRFSGESWAAPGNYKPMKGITPHYAQNVEIAGNYGGVSYAIAADGNYVYLGIGLKLVVLDISDPTHPMPTGDVLFTDVPQDIAIASGYAYVAAGSAGLRVVDISNPSAPVEVGFYLPEIDPLENPPGPALSVVVSNGYAYVTFEAGDFRAVDVSNPSHPVQVGWYTTSGSARDVALTNHYAYIADGDEGIRVLDISDPAYPTEISSYTPSGFGFVSSIVISGTYAYVPGENTITVLDISNVLSPTQLASYEQPNLQSKYIALADGYAYVTSIAGLYAFQTSSSGSLTYSGYFPMASVELSQIIATGGYAYLADGFFSLKVIDTSNPTAMVEVGSYDMPEFFDSMAVVGNYVCAIAQNGHFWVLNSSDPTRPDEVGYLLLGVQGELKDIAAAGNYAYVTDSQYGLLIVDISDPAHPAEISRLPLPDNAYGIAVAGSYAFVAASFSGLRVVDISDPLHPVEVGSYIPESGYPLDIAVKGNYAYIANMADLKVVDISDPTHPTPVGGALIPATRVVISDQIAYVRAYFSSYLIIVDISDPPYAEVLSAYYPDQGVLDMAVIGNNVYFTNQYGLSVLDISNPVQPTEVGFYNYQKPSPHSLIVAVNEFVYIYTNSIYTNGDDTGLSILDFTGLSIEGQVLQANRLPMPGVTLSLTSALTTTTDKIGNYTFGELARGTYTVTPSLPGFAFWPSSYTLTLPPNGVHQDFTILPLPVSITLTPGLSNTLTLTDTQGLTTTVFFPAGAVTETMTLTLTPTLGAEGGAWAFAGHAFDLTAYRDGLLLPDLTFNVPVTATIHYSDVDVRLLNDESQLALWAWVDSGWQDTVQTCEPPSGYWREEDDNVLSLAICRVGRFKLMGPTYAVFLPVVLSP